MLDRDGYRPNVGIVLLNGRNEVFWGKRIREHSWQFPQGGIKRGESPEQAMYRELREEVGLMPGHVRVVGRTRDWLRYEVPEHWVRREWRGHYRGQKQIWFLLRLTGRDSDIDLRASDHPEFDAWRWHEYWVPLDAVIEFKREVYRMALEELSRFLAHRHDPQLRFLRQGPRHRGRGGVPPGALPPGARAAELPPDAVIADADMAHDALIAEAPGASGVAPAMTTFHAGAGGEARAHHALGAASVAASLTITSPGGSMGDVGGSMDDVGGSIGAVGGSIGDVGASMGNAGASRDAGGSGLDGDVRR